MADKRPTPSFYIRAYFYSSLTSCLFNFLSFLFPSALYLASCQVSSNSVDYNHNNVLTTICCLSYSQAADPVLKQIADDTGGSSFYFSGSLVSPAMQDALLATIERRRNKDSPVTVSSFKLLS